MTITQRKLFIQGYYVKNLKEKLNVLREYIFIEFNDTASLIFGNIKEPSQVNLKAVNRSEFLQKETSKAS